MSLLAGCGARPEGRPQAPQIGLARGVRWSVLSLGLPTLTGPFFQLTLHDHVLIGWISGETAPAGAVRVRIEDDGASGFGPHGTVAMDFSEEMSAIAADGLWNGQRVSLLFSSDGVRGTVADGGATPRAPSGTSCQYVLDERDASGALVGVSICAGMPQETRLEVPRAAAALLTRPELVTVLVAVLSAPPLALAEPFPSRVDDAEHLDLPL